MTVQITSDDYFTGPGKVRRDLAYPGDMSSEIRDNAAELVSKVNLLLLAMVQAGVVLQVDPSTGSLSHSGWRPPAVNAATPRAAKKSKHMVGLADDLFDPDGALDAWCLANLHVLEAIGLWLEHPDSTPRWCHVQIRAPKSGNRVFRP